MCFQVSINSTDRAEVSTERSDDVLDIIDEVFEGDPGHDEDDLDAVQSQSWINCGKKTSIQEICPVKSVFE